MPLTVLFVSTRFHHPLNVSIWAFRLPVTLELSAKRKFAQQFQALAQCVRVWLTARLDFACNYSNYNNNKYSNNRTAALMAIIIVILTMTIVFFSQPVSRWILSKEGKPNRKSQVFARFRASLEGWLSAGLDFVCGRAVLCAGRFRWLRKISCKINRMFNNLSRNRCKK